MVIFINFRLQTQVPLSRSQKSSPMPLNEFRSRLIVVLAAGRHLNNSLTHIAELLAHQLTPLRLDQQLVSSKGGGVGCIGTGRAASAPPIMMELPPPHCEHAMRNGIHTHTKALLISGSAAPSQRDRGRRRRCRSRAAPPSKTYVEAPR